MANFNKVILAGNLTRDPQLSYLPSNTPVAEFGLAINRRWKSQDGQDREEVCFVDLRCYGRQAETLNKYVKKGRPLLVEGHLRYDQWETKEGQKRSRLWVIVDNFQFLDSKRDGGGDEGGGRESGGRESGGREGGSRGYSSRGGSDRDSQVAPEADFAPASGDEVPF